jgi:iron complex transport system substrate-binding protein
VIRPQLLAPVLCLLACAPAPGPQPQPVESAPPPGFPLELEGRSGRRSRLPRPAVRVLPGNAGALDLWLAVAEPTTVAAINRGTRPYSVALGRGVTLEGLPELPTFDLENVATLGPDLVITHTWQVLDKGPFLERLQVPVLELGEFDGLPGLERDLTSLAAAAGDPARGVAVIEDLRARVAQLARRDRRAFSAMTYSTAGNGGWSAGSGTNAATLCAWAQVTQATAAAGLSGHFELDYERLLHLDPQVLLISSEDGTLESSTTYATLRADGRLAGLRVLSPEGLLVAVPDRILGTTSHHLLEGAEALAAAIDGRWPER